MLDVQSIRKQFPALREQFDGKPLVFFDNPGGTQVPQRVIDAMTDYLIRRNANVGGAFETSRRTDATIAEARQAAADFLGAETDEVVFGNNMTSLTFQLSQALAREIKPEDEIVVTRLDHSANVSPWTLLAEDTGATLRIVDVDVESCTLDMDDLHEKVNARTKLVAVGYASNAAGTINDIQGILDLAKQNNAYSFVDAVQYAPHGPIDVKALDCDFLACSAYKFFGPHVGLLYGKREQMNRLRKYQVRPAADHTPGRWETGTKNHEGIAGTAAAINYLADIGVEYGNAQRNDERRTKLDAAWLVINEYEQMLIDRLITGLQTIPGVRIYGLTSRFDFEKRVATIALRKQGTSPAELARALAAQNINVTDGNFYALDLTERLGVEPSGGLLRIGLAHYNTADEVQQCLDVIDGI